MENFRAAGSKGAGFVVAELVQKARFGGFAGIRGVDAVDVGPNDELIGVHDVRNDGTGKIGAVAAERGDAAIGSCADKASNYRDDAGFEEGKKKVAAALFRLFEMRMGVAKGIAGQDEIRGCDRHRRDAGLFERGSEEPGAEAFAKGGEAVEELRTSGDAAANRNFVAKVASQKLQVAAYAKAAIFAELQILEYIEVKIPNELGFAAGIHELAIDESAGNGKKMVGDALHGGNDHGDAGCLRGGANEICGMEHAVRTKKRTPAELEGEDVPLLLAYRAGAVHLMVQRGGSTFRCRFFLNVFETHDLRS